MRRDEESSVDTDMDSNADPEDWDIEELVASAGLALFMRFLKLVGPALLSDPEAAPEKMVDVVSEQKALKLLSFPDMDSDALPSVYCGKVVACACKWQLKAKKLADAMDSSSPVMAP